MSLATIVLFVLGIVFLVAGAEALVRGAARLAGAVGLPPLVIGLTVVAYGTGAPEVAVSLSALSKGQADLSIGNVVGSNISNLLLILGISALAAPLAVSRRLIRLDVPLMIAASVVVYLMSLDGRIGQVESAALLFSVVAYTAFLVLSGRRGNKTSASVPTHAGGVRTIALQVTLIVAGLALLVQGSDWLIRAAVSIATTYHVSELVIGLTIVAVGTSLPEMATSLMATVRGQRDIAVGNVIGSSIFNLLMVLGVAGLFSKGGIAVNSAATSFDIPVMIAASVACLPVFYTGRRIARWEGVLFLAYYAAYLAYLVLAATKHDALPVFSTVMLVYVLPLTAIALAAFAVRARRNARSRPAASPDG